MKKQTKIKLKAAGLAGLLGASAVFAGCPNPVTAKTCECPAGTTHEPGEKCCEGEDCKCAIAEPATKSFTINLILKDAETVTATVQDARTACGSANLQEMGITKQIEDAINGACAAGINPTKTKFHNVFNGIAGNRVIIIVDNSTTYYDGIQTPEKYKMNIHADYLKGTPVDIQQKITDAVSAMNSMKVVAKLFSNKILAQIPQGNAGVTVTFFGRSAAGCA